MILGIVIISIGGILVWGVPAIDGLQKHAEFQSVQVQMLELNQDLRNLRDPQNTRIVTLALAGGGVSMSAGDRWVITGMTLDDYDGFSITGYENDAATSIGLSGVPVNASTATIETVVGGTFVLEDSVPCTPCLTLDLGGGDLAADVFRVQIKESSLVRAEAWIFNAGRITYDQGRTNNLNHLEMGASLIDQDGAVFLRQSSTIKEPLFTATPSDTDFFVRAIQLDGDSAVAGEGDFSVLVNLVDNYGVSRGRPLMESAQLVRFQIDGDLEEAFCNHLLSSDAYYQYNGTTVDCAGGDANVLYDPSQSFVYELNHAVVNTLVRIA